MEKKLIVLLLAIILLVHYDPVIAQNDYYNFWQSKVISFNQKVSNDSQGSPSVVVAIIDAGIDFSHYDLGYKLKYNNPGEIPNNGVDDDHNGYIDDTYGWDFVENDNNVTPTLAHIDDNNNGIYDELASHGTSIAGIIAGQGEDVLGIVPNIKILDIKVFNSDGGAVDIKKGFDYVYNLSLKDSRIKVINFSGKFAYTSGSGFNQTLDKLMANDVTIVASSGNDYNKGEYNVSYPANYPGVISVGSIDKNEQISSFSQRGENLDFVAPGENVFSLSIGNQINNNLDGTSFSAPFYSAAVAFIDSFHYKTPLTQTEIFNLLKNSTTDLGSPGWDPIYGYGLLNMTKLVNNILPLTIQTTPSLSIGIFSLAIVTIVLIKKSRKINLKSCF